jgi:tetratricopeptide (TPR) repeat protein
MRAYLLAAAALVLATTPTLAQPAPAACQHTPAILAAADLMLQVPREKPRFWRDLHGSDAAYLQIRYGRLDLSSVPALLERLEARDRKPERLAELRMSHARTQGRLALIALLDPAQSRGSPLPQLGTSVLRALIVEDGGGWLVAEMRRWLDANPDQNGFAYTVAQAAGRAIADTDDATKAALARAAEAAGLFRLAFAANAHRDDLAPLVALIDRAPVGAFFPGPLSPEQRNDLLRQALVLAELREGFDMAIQLPELKVFDAKNPPRVHLRNLYRLAAVFPEASLLMTLLNQSGEISVASELAPELLKGIKGGRYDPARASDVAFVAMIEGIDRILGVEQRKAMLAGFDLVDPFGRGTNAGDYADHIVARNALAPIVAAGGGAIERPMLLSSKYDWDSALRIARQLGARQPVPETDWLRAAGLLAGAGKFEEAIELLGQLADETDAAAAAHRLAIMLDRTCANVLAPPLPLFPSLYRFAPRN